MENAPYSDYYVHKKCIQFSTDYGGRLAEKGLRQCFLMHMFSLWDIGLVEANTVDACMRNYDKAEQGDSNGPPVGENLSEPKAQIDRKPTTSG
eukprot:SAG31_NODE_1958_length_6814_cov_3.386597_5_plen_93_part_00